MGKGITMKPCQSNRKIVCFFYNYLPVLLTGVATVVFALTIVHFCFQNYSPQYTAHFHEYLRNR